MGSPLMNFSFLTLDLQSPVVQHLPCAILTLLLMFLFPPATHFPRTIQNRMGKKGMLIPLEGQCHNFLGCEAVVSWWSKQAFTSWWIYSTISQSSFASFLSLTSSLLRNSFHFPSCVLKMGHILHLTSSGESFMVGLKNSETKSNHTGCSEHKNS